MIITILMPAHSQRVSIGMLLAQPDFHLWSPRALLRLWTRFLRVTRPLSRRSLKTKLCKSQVIMSLAPPPCQTMVT